MVLPSHPTTATQSETKNTNYSDNGLSSILNLLSILLSLFISKLLLINDSVLLILSVKNKDKIHLFL